MIHNKISPNISFGIIVLNGEPFTKYCLRQLYPHAYQIIVVEGAVRSAEGIAPSGHSHDGTREALYEFKRDEDPENKVQIVTKEGFWAGKDEQSNEYAKRATGDYLWQVDIDEFYKQEDIIKVIDLLKNNPEVDTLSFRVITFWGWFDYWCDSILLRACNASEYHRLFKWKNSYKYAAHRPPTVIDQEGIDLRQKNWLPACKTEALGVYLYHYSLLFPKQVREKSLYYSKSSGAYIHKADKWAEECYFKMNYPFKVHNIYKYPSWMLRFEGKHPGQIEQMRRDILSGKLIIDTRGTEDIEKLLSNKKYLFARTILIFLDKLKVYNLLLFLKRRYF